jgi:hypothetical protein
MILRKVRVKGDVPETSLAAVSDVRQQDCLAKLLDVSGRNAFKVWKLSPLLGALDWTLAAAAVGGTAWFLYTCEQDRVSSTLGAALPASVTTITLAAWACSS